MTDKQIAQRLQQKDDAIFNYIIENYNKLLWAVVGNILMKVGSTEDIEDCITDVYIKIFEAPKMYDYKKGSFKSFIVRIGKNKAIDKYRKLARENFALSYEDYEAHDDGDMLTTMLTKESRMIVYDAVDRLKEPDREIVIRRYFFDEKVKVISEKMNLKPKEIENKLYQGKLKLRNVLMNEGGI